MSRSATFKNLGQNAIAIIRNLCFSLSVIGVLIFIIMAATYEPDDPMSHSFDATFESDNSIVEIDEHLVASNVTALAGCNEIFNDSIDCANAEVFQLLMGAAMQKFQDIDFFRFGRPVRGINGSSCHMAWHFKLKRVNTSAFDRDYRDFLLAREKSCRLSVIGIGDYRSGVNAMKTKWKAKDVEKLSDDSIPTVGLDSSFSSRKYLVYSGGGDKCKSMHQFLYSFNCMLAEAQYLNRTLVLDFSICLPAIYTSSGQDENGKDFRFYFDLEHLKDSISMVDQRQFWSEWIKRQRHKQGLTHHLVEDYRVTPMKLAGVEDTLIMRKFGTVEPDNYWYRVCEGETDKVVQRPWDIVLKSRSLLDVASAIAMRMDWDYDAVRVERGEKARNKEQWPNLDIVTSPEALMLALQDKIEAGRKLYISTDEANTSFFDPLRAKYSIHFLDEFKDMWDEDSDWYAETMRINNGRPVKLDRYMRIFIEEDVLLKAKKKIETSNDLTKDCKDGINTCTTTS